MLLLNHILCTATGDELKRSSWILVERKPIDEYTFSRYVANRMTDDFYSNQVFVGRGRIRDKGAQKRQRTHEWHTDAEMSGVRACDLEPHVIDSIGSLFDTIMSAVLLNYSHMVIVC